nr:MOSC domain-containing protein [Kibdelosporangium sp. MJ126-NF4]CEL17986.1 Uncharacterized protein conserved in bacteria [Kibdelosporangium sp. MJ126-NF4]CTQ90786.1 Uncharacterized protein conserved in bacteria [Kibdelosporangium sp. MJ126-NF4]
MGVVLSVNVGLLRPMLAATGKSGIDKRPAAGPVTVTVPQAGTSGLADDAISDGRFHGGPDRAVHAYAREDLDVWQHELGTQLHCGIFGENLTTAGLDVTNVEIGERWRIGAEVVLEVSAPRIPCRTFAAWLKREKWMRTFTERHSRHRLGSVDPAASDWDVEAAAVNRYGQLPGGCRVRPAAMSLPPHSLHSSVDRDDHLISVGW